MTQPSIRTAPDEAMAFGAIAVFLLMVLLGPLSVLAFAVPWMFVWAFRSMTPAAVLLAAAVPVLIGFAISPTFWTGVITAWQTMIIAVASFDLRRGIAAWFSLGTDHAVTLWALSVGVFLGSAVRLIAADSSNSGLKALMPPTKRPAPTLKRNLKRLSTTPASLGDRAVLGLDWSTGQRVYISDAELNNHVMVLGTTGRGKSVTTLNLIEAHIERGDPVLVIDGKGDLEAGRKGRAFAAAHGRKAYLFHGQGGDDSCAYNPFTTLDFSALSDLVLTLHDWTEPYYRVLAGGYMQTVFKVAVATGQPFDLLSIEALMSTSAMLKAVRAHRTKIDNAQELSAEIVKLQLVEEAGIEGLRGLLRNLAASTAAPLFDTRGPRPVINLSKARKEGAFVYFALPALVFPELAKAIGKLVINDARLALTQGGPWLIVLDELSTFAGEQLLHLVNQGRGFGARVVLSGQSFSDLSRSVQSEGDAFANQVLASVNSLIVHQVNSPKDAELVAEYAGTFHKLEITAQVVEKAATGAGSARDTNQFLVAPDELKRLATGEAIVISKRRNTITKIGSRLSRIATMAMSKVTVPDAPTRAGVGNRDEDRI